MYKLVTFRVLISDPLHITWVIEKDLSNSKAFLNVLWLNFYMEKGH